MCPWSSPTIPSLAELQDALAELATSDDRAPIPASIPACLAGLSETDLRRYARGLRHKRWAEVAATVPLAVMVIPDLEIRYDAWLRGHPPPACDSLLSPGAAEALRALPALARGVAGDPGQASYAADLLAFEVLRTCARADGLARSLSAGFPVHALAGDLRAGLVPIDPPREAYLYQFDRGGARHRRLP